MASNRWATEEQLGWLRGRVPDFTKARDDGTLAKFWPSTYQAWFDTYPESAPSEADIAESRGDVDAAVRKKRAAREDQVYWWYNNNCRGAATGQGKQKVLQLGKKSRKMHMEQAYLKLYGDRIKPLIRQRWDEHLKQSGPDEFKNHLKFYNECAKELLEGESEEVKEKVRQYRESRMAPVEGEGTSATNEIKEKQSAIDGIPCTLAACLQDLHRLTGWVGSIVVGGPDPRTGSFQCLSYHVGTTVNAGNRFDQACPIWQDAEEAFGKFVPKCYGPNEEKHLHNLYTGNVSHEGTSESHSRAASAAVANHSSGGEQQEQSVKDTGERRQESGPSQDVEDLEAVRERQMRDNQRLMTELGLDKPPLEPARNPPRPLPRKRGPNNATRPPPSDRSTRSGDKNKDIPMNQVDNGEREATLVSATDVQGGETQVPPSPRNSSPGDKSQATEPSSPSPSPSPSSHAQPPATPSSTSHAPAAATPKPTSPLSPHAPASDTPPSTSDTPAMATAESTPPLSKSQPVESLSPASMNHQLPPWWTEALAHLKTITDDSTWQAMCDAWIKREQLLEFPDGTMPNRVAITNRPAEIRAWLDRGRKYDKPPVVDSQVFGASWKSWWLAIQPEWRGKSWPPSQVRSAEPAADWGTLDRGGCNGIFMVILSLGWWWSAVVEAGEDVNEVRMAVDDVRWVISVMGCTLGKRSGDGAKGSAKKARTKK